MPKLLEAQREAQTGAEPSGGKGGEAAGMGEAQAARKIKQPRKKRIRKKVQEEDGGEEE